MSNAEELKKFKELFDAGIITEEDFEKKKNEVLSKSVQQKSTVAELESLNKESQKKTINKVVLKKILIVVGIIAILVIVFFAGNSIVEKNQKSKRAAALESAIASIMVNYGLSDYTVKYVDYSYDVFAEGFGSLTNGQALSCLKELDKVSVDDPCGDGKIDFGLMPHVHPGLDVEYSYWRVSSLDVWMNKTYGGNYKKAGIYCNQYGTTCVYECEN